MHEENLWKTRIVLQSVAIFVAISVFLGRIYFLSFYERLGLPVTDVPVNIIDYSIISPNVTLFCFIISVFIGLLVMFRVQIKNMVTLARLKYEAWALLWFLALLSGIFVEHVYQAFGPEFPFIYGFLMSLVVVLAALSGLFLSAYEDERKSEKMNGQSGATMNSNADGEPDTLSKRVFKRLKGVFGKCSRYVRDVRQTVRSLLPVIVILSIIGLLPWSASQVAKQDAVIAYENAPTAHARLVTEGFALQDQQRDDGCEMCANVYHVGVVAMGDRFVYLRAYENDVLDNDSEVFAIPIDDLEFLVFDALPQ